MKLVKTLIAIAAIGVGSQAFGKAYPGLEVGFTFREVKIIVEDISRTPAAKIGLTTEDIERKARLKLLSLGLKVISVDELQSPTGSYIYINANITPSAVSYTVKLRKYANHFGIPLSLGTGKAFDPQQGQGGRVGLHGGSKKVILDGVELVVEDFMLNYLESNLKYDETFRDKKLKDIDRTILRAANNSWQKKERVPSLDNWIKRYKALMNQK
jgi:hypothetical protein